MGDFVPAEACLLRVRDLQVRESSLTGESLSIEKSLAELSTEKQGIAEASNSVFLGPQFRLELVLQLLFAQGATPHAVR